MFERLTTAGELAAAQARLAGSGVGSGHIVAWIGFNSTTMLALLATCEQCGAVLLPLNWRLAPAELAATLMHAGAAHLLHGEGFDALAASLRPALARGEADGIEPGDLLLVYTSGTTGEPKGAVHTVASMAANVQAAIEAQGLDEHTRALSVLPLFHVGGLCIQTLPTLLAGGAVRLHARFDPATWFDDVAGWRATTSLLVPAVMRSLIDHPRWATADLSSLHFVVAGSQIVPRPLIDAFHRRGVAVAQVYGGTETGPVSIVLPPAQALARVGQAGRAALGVQVRLAADGEIALRAPNLMRRYHRSAHMGFDADGWFTTGDRAREVEPGWYEVVGRSSDLIISGGENVHPAEIEQLLAGRPEVAECAVVGVPDPRWGEVPVLAVVASAGAEVDVAALRALFEARLARFKHPRRIVVVESLPKTALGKVQRGMLARRLGA